MELGIYTFGDLGANPLTGEAPSARERFRQVLDMGRLADELGLDVFAVGEHHRLDMVVSSPAVVLAAVARETRRIRLSSATTLLNTLDPVRVFEDFATLDHVSEGRAEVIAGRGSFTESFGLFGHDMADYDDLFAEHLDLFLKLRQDATVTWEGHHRPSLHEAEVAPRPASPIPLWIGVGGTPQSAVRAGLLGLPMNIAILGGPERFQQLAGLHERAWAQGGHDPAARRLAVSSHGLLGDDAAGIQQEFWELYSRSMRKGLRNRFPPREIPREYFDMEVGPRGGIYCGDAKQAVERIAWERKILGMDRLMLQFDFGGIPYAKVRRSIEILGTEVLPEVRQRFPKTG